MEKKLQKIMQEFEKRNNISIYLEIHSDGSGQAYEAWHETSLIEFSTEMQMLHFLRKTKYKLDERGLCISPVIEE